MADNVPMTPSPMTLPQVDHAVRCYRAVLEKHRREIGSSQTIQKVLSSSDYLDEQLQVILRHVGVYIDPVVRVASPRKHYKEGLGVGENFIFPDLQLDGPDAFDVKDDVEHWVCNDESDRVTIDVVFDHMKKYDLITRCLSIIDLKAIEDRGLQFFQQHFGGNAVFALKSAVENPTTGRKYVPHLVGDTYRSKIMWSAFGKIWRPEDVALIFKKYPQAA